MSKILKYLLWFKFYIVIFMFLISFSLNFLISSKIVPETSFHLLLYGKPALVLLYLFVQNIIFKFPKKLVVPPLIPSVFLMLSVLIFIDIGFLVGKYWEVLSPHKIFWLVYGIVLVFCGMNLRKFIKAFTVGIPDSKK